MAALVVPAASTADETAPAGTQATVASDAAATSTFPGVQDAVALVERHYRNLADLTAKVIQKNYLRSVNKTQTFEGVLAIKRPGKLRLEYTNGQLIVIDGKEAWFYSKKSEQAIRRTFKDFEQANIPVAFLLGAANITKEFDVIAQEGGQTGILDLVPRKQEGAAMKKVRLHADEAGRIIRLIVFDRSGNTSDVQFSAVREDVGIDVGQFSFRVPKGTEVIEQ